MAVLSERLLISALGLVRIVSTRVTTGSDATTSLAPVSQSVTLYITNMNMIETRLLHPLTFLFFVNHSNSKPSIPPPSPAFSE